MPIQNNNRQGDEMMWWAVSLNNIGISLLSRGFHQDALATLKESIGSLKLSLLDAKTTDEQRAKGKQLLQEAFLRLSKTGKSSSISSCGVAHQPLVSVLDHNEHDFSVTEHALSADVDTVSYCIRIESNVNQEKVDENFVTAIIMYNVSLAHLVLAQSRAGQRSGTGSHLTPSPAKIEKLKKSALKLLQMTTGILTSSQNKNKNGSDLHYHWNVLCCLTQAQELNLLKQLGLCESMPTKVQELESHILHLQAEISEIGLMLYPAKLVAAAA